MKTMPFRCLLLFVLLGVSLAAQPAPTATEERQARSRQATAKRMAHAASEKYHPYNSDIRDIRKSTFDLLENKKLTEAIAAAEKGLERFPCDVDLHLALAVAWRETGDQAKADQFRAEYLGLVDSILNSGTGRDHASAYHVISVDEEYVVLRILRLKVVKQTLTYHEGHAFDLMTVKRGDAEPETSVYFNVDLPKRWLDKQLAAPAKK
jgi:hypothetical protein